MKGVQSLLGIAKDSKLWAGPWSSTGEIRLVKVGNQMVLYQRCTRDRWEQLDMVDSGTPPTKRHVKWLRVEESTLEELQHERGEFSIN